MKKIVILLIAITCFSIGCASSNNFISTVSLSGVAIEPLKSSEYMILGDTEGSGSSWSILFIPFGGSAEQEAYNNAVSKVKGADALIAPRIHQSSFFAFFFSTQTVKITAKAIRIKEHK
jgi:hypothetical protein